MDKGDLPRLEPIRSYQYSYIDSLRTLNAPKPAFSTVGTNGDEFPLQPLKPEGQIPTLKTVKRFRVISPS
jgi:hypothetical protein